MQASMHYFINFFTNKYDLVSKSNVLRQTNQPLYCQNATHGLRTGELFAAGIFRGALINQSH
jgi:hypothetical protein